MFVHLDTMNYHFLKEFKKKLHQVLKEEFSIEGYKDFSIVSEYACN